MRYDYSNVCRYRRKIVVHTRYSGDIVWLTPMVRHDHPNIIKTLDTYEKGLVKVAQSYNDCESIAIYTLEVPYVK